MSILKEKIEAQRAAYVAGMKMYALGMKKTWGEMSESVARIAAANTYPMTETRPRVLRIPNTNPGTSLTRPFAEYKIENGMLYYRFPLKKREQHSALDGGENWKATYNETPDTLRAKLALFSSPTEEVEIK